MSALNTLVFPRELPSIHVLSDVHLESGPYDAAAARAADIIVAAGDIGPLEQAVPWLAALGKPVVYVLGNHEYYGQTLSGAVRLARQLAQGTQVHILDNQAVVIRGVRFLGTTLWTSYGQWTPSLVQVALRRMRDYRHIELGDWLSAHPTRRAKFETLCRRAGLACPDLSGAEPLTRFHPAVGYALHQRAVSWLDRQLSADTRHPTVVVTHHAPAYACLAGKGVREELWIPTNWRRAGRDSDDLVHVAAYASDLTELLRRHRQALSLWVHGHVHAGQDLLVQGVRVLSNPRGRHVAPLTPESARAFALFGCHVSEEDIARSQERAQAEPYRGDAEGFDSELLVRLSQGHERPLTRVCSDARGELSACLSEIQEVLPSVVRASSRTRGVLALDVPARAVDQWLERLVSQFEARATACFDQLVQAQTRFGAANHLHPVCAAPHMPYLPYRREEWTQDALSRIVEDAQDWLRYLDRMPYLAVEHLKAWGHASLGTLECLAEQGLSARVARPPATAWRCLDDCDVVVVLEPPASLDVSSRRKELDRLTLLLDAKLNPRLPRHWFLRLQYDCEDLCGQPLRSPLRLTDLRRALAV